MVASFTASIMDSHLDWIPYGIAHGKSLHIKDEPSDSHLIRPSLCSSSTRPFPSSRRGSTSSTGPVRQRPYPSLSSDLPSRRTQSDSMSSSQYGSWGSLRSGNGRSHRPVERRSSDEEQYSLNPYMSEPYMINMPESAELRPPSSNSSLTSSLTGAMGEPDVSSQSRGSRSPPSNAAVYSGTLPSQELSWTNNQLSLGSYPGNLGFPNIPSSVTPMPFNDYSGSRSSSSPEALAPPSPPYSQSFASDQYNRNPVPVSTRSEAGYSSSSMPTTFSSPPNVPGALDVSSTEHEMRRLRRKVRELEMELTRSRKAAETVRNSSRLPTPPHSSSFQTGWKARTEARKKLFCSLNRAGNALCAWHDSRRERRAFPPRNAPAGYLNCGCTYNEALFEESLSRHGVGSYHPGESVRMDPALRNPLLKLLQRRYGYKDGDFEHNPATEEWAEGESPAIWEQKAHSGQIIRRRPDSKDSNESRA